MLEGPPQRNVLDEPDSVDFEKPPVGLLRFLGDLHDTCHVPVTYYACRMWGGDVEEEAAWIFAGTDLVYRYRSPTETRETDARGQRIIQSGVLPLALAHHGLSLAPSGYFAPHTRGFDWKGRRLLL